MSDLKKDFLDTDSKQAGQPILGRLMLFVPQQESQPDITYKLFMLANEKGPYTVNHVICCEMLLREEHDFAEGINPGGIRIRRTADPNVIYADVPLELLTRDKMSVAENNFRPIMSLIRSMESAAVYSVLLDRTKIQTPKSPDSAPKSEP